MCAIRLAALLAACGALQAADRPNILFILSDDHTAQAWGVYGSFLDPVVSNPNIDRLAREGALLPNVFCANSICTPSRASILTGQYSHHNGVYTLADALDPKRITVAGRLQAAGYQTALFGKWHLKRKPSGFDTFRVLPGQGRYRNPLLKGPDDWADGNAGGSPVAGFSEDVITNLCLEWLEGRDATRPFLLLCHFKATHEPFDYPERHARLYEDVVMPEPESLYEMGPDSSGRTFAGQTLEVLGKRYANTEGSGFHYPGKLELPEGLDPRERRHRIYQKFVKDFLRCGRAIDDNIGRLLEYLDVHDLSANTIVIYTSDQGYFLGEHGFFDKRMMYEEPLQMPFVIRYPREISPGARPEALVQNIDFAPLMLDYAGIDIPPEMDGRSFREILRGRTPADWRDAIYYRYWQHLAARPAHYGIRTRTEKLIRFYGAPLDMTGAEPEPTAPAWEYYDLQRDPRELHNGYGDPANDGNIARLQRMLEALKTSVGDAR